MLIGRPKRHFQTELFLQLDHVGLLNSKGHYFRISSSVEMDLSESSFRTGKTVTLRIGGKLFVCHFHQNEKIQKVPPKMYRTCIQ